MARPCSSCAAWGVKCGTKRSVREPSGPDRKSCAFAASALNTPAVPRGGGGAAVAAVRGPLGSASAAVAAVAARMSGPD